MFALRDGKDGDPQARAFAALTDSAGPAHETARAELKPVPLAGGDTVRLGASASLAVNTAFGDGARALRIAGPVSLSLRSDSSALAAIQVGSQRFVTAGMVGAFNTDAAGLVLVQVDSGDVVLVRDSVRIRLSEGSIVRIGSGTPMPLTRDQRNAAFGWRQGRLQLRSASLGVIAAAVKQWFDVDVRYPSDRAQSDTASLDVPLASRDSLRVALESALNARAEVSGDRITLRVIGPSPPRSGRAAPTRRRAPLVARVADVAGGA
jgi:ferric-dicitrate binding protein FerR (iron transport regulator)